jgi:GTP cyclohydrolase III
MATRSALIDWAVATLALPGEAESGDLHLVTSVASGVLVAVADGLGHGVEAATAARAAVTALERHAHEAPCL